MCLDVSQRSCQQSNHLSRAQPICPLPPKWLRLVHQRSINTLSEPGATFLTHTLGLSVHGHAILAARQPAIQRLPSHFTTTADRFTSSIWMVKTTTWRSDELEINLSRAATTRRMVFTDNQIVQWKRNKIDDHQLVQWNSLQYFLINKMQTFAWVSFTLRWIFVGRVRMFFEGKPFRFNDSCPRNSGRKYQKRFRVQRKWRVFLKRKDETMFADFLVDFISRFELWVFKWVRPKICFRLSL